jgi:5'-nucleotidase/UDP-sugar diphosphatase
MAEEFFTYVVGAGDSLSAIAKKFYGDTNRWKEIWEANKDKLPDPNLITVGQELRIPGHIGTAPADARVVKARRGEQEA